MVWLNPIHGGIAVKRNESDGADVAVVVQEGPVKAGFAAEVVRRIVEEGFGLLDYAPMTLGAWDVPVPFSPVLEDAAIPQAGDIAGKIEEVLARKG